MSSQPSSPELPADDAPVGDEVLLYRLIPTSWCTVVDGQWEFQSGAFDNASVLHEGEHPDDMSVILSDTLAALGRVPEDLPSTVAWEAEDRLGVAVLRTSFVRDEEEQEIRRTPTPDERAHGDVRGKKGSRRRKRFKRHAEWVVRPTAPPNDG
ncbi:MAG: hypothetical protein HZB46_02545 [Solirubrobacterales bacterium]|nr:hypothetical protein [Solirubrobacterales bacterium]